MSLWIVAAQGLLVVGVLAAVAYPLVWREVEDAQPLGPPGDGGQAREDLLAQKHLAYEAIKELEFDRASGKLSEADYQTMHKELEAEAIGVLKKLDALEGPEVSVPPPAPDACPSCGHVAEPDHDFCSGCGAKLR